MIADGSGLTDFVNPLQYLMPLDDYNDCSSPADDKQTSNKRKGSKQSEKKNKVATQLSRHQSFSKSWPRLDSNRDEGGPQTLPKIPSSRHRSMDASKASSGSISTDIAKFNKSRAFRLRSHQKSSEKLKPKNVSYASIFKYF